ncbi:unnamed protein product [Durusdinium trenchii]|uniref:Protein phosphatase n=2 Tax=Durusdinium trenchii TaxID=1381693 RepID=A0ABP0I298_9DINO
MAAVLRRVRPVLQAPWRVAAWHLPHCGARQERCFSDFITASDEGTGRLRLAFAAACLPHPEKVEKGGEDGYFACPARRAFGVADGVGGWADNGVDPGLFARRLLQLCLEGIEEQSDLHEALLEATQRILKEKLEGGSTALLGQLDGSTMGILNLGDSGAMLLRPALRTPPQSDSPLLFPRVVFRSCDQTHYFNCPYQLGSGNAPVEAPDFIRVRVRIGDLVVAATDGVFDNLFDHQVQAIVAQQLGKAWSQGAPVTPHLNGLATSIAKQAQRIGQQEDHKDIITPFALAAHSEGLSFRGGKLDDTTVVVGLVCSDTGEGGPGDQALLNNF